MTISLDIITSTLIDPCRRVSAEQFRALRPKPTSAGLYAWWADDEAQVVLGQSFEVTLSELIYAGQTGATAWPSGRPSSATLASRIGQQHFRGATSASTFRRTLASTLREPLGLIRDEANTDRLVKSSNERLTAWIADHLEVSFCAIADKDTLGEVEVKVLERLDPPLNIDHRPATPTRARLTELRRWLR